MRTNYTSPTSLTHLSPKLTQGVRQALAKHVDSVLFDPASEEGKAFHKARLAGRPAAEQAALQASMKAEASRWISSLNGWGRTLDPDGSSVYRGPFFKLATEITLDRQLAVTKVTCALA